MELQVAFVPMADAPPSVSGAEPTYIWHRSARREAGLAMLLLVVAALAQLSQVGNVAMILEVFGDAQAGRKPAIREVNAWSNQYALTWYLLIAGYVLVALAMAIWAKAIARNTIAAGAFGVSLSPKQAGRRMLLPVFPDQAPNTLALDQMWMASDPNRDPIDWRLGESSWWTGCWHRHILLVIASFSITAKTGAGFDFVKGNTIDATTEGMIVICMDLIVAAHALLCVAMVWKLTARQDRRFEIVGLGAPAPVRREPIGMLATE